MLRNYLMRLPYRRDPDMLIGSPADPYMRRWFVIPRNKFFNVYLHHFRHSDDDRALHDHPWWNVSYLLEGEYTEHTIAAGGVNTRIVYKKGALKFRWATAAHRIELESGTCWTLFMTGPKIRKWGFHCPLGWKPWEKFVNLENTGEIGPGCD